MTIRRLECHVFRVPIEAPVTTSFGTMTSRPALFLRLVADDGAWGWGEVFCNFPAVGAEHRARLADSLFGPLLAACAFDDPERVREFLKEKVRRLAIQCGEPGPFAQVMGGIDQALWDIAGRRAGQPLWKLLAPGPGASPRVRVYASGLGPDDVARTALAARAGGYAAFKFKVGFPHGKDRANFEAIRAALGAGATIMIDANQAWSPENAAERIAELAPFDPAWIEEPLAADEPIAQWQALRIRCAVPLAAGENLIGLPAFEQALSAGYLSCIQPDVAKWGGLTGARVVALLARAHGAVFCPHWLGGGVGLAASLHLRAALGPDGFAEVDANPNPLREIVCPLAPREGWVTLSDAPGLGVEPDLGSLAPYRVKHG